MRRACIAAFTALLTATAAVAIPAESAGASPPAASPPQRATVAYQNLPLPHGHATVYSDGLAEVFHDASAGTPSGVEFRWVPRSTSDALTSSSGGAAEDGALLPPKEQLISDLAHAAAAPYQPGGVVVVYRDGVSAPTTFSASTGRAGAVPHYTSRPALNSTLVHLGVDRSRRLFTNPSLDAQRLVAQRALGRQLVNFTHAYVLHLDHASVPAAVAALRASSDVAYAAPNWTVATTHTPPYALPKASSTAAGPASATGAGIPSNYALSASAQSLLNRPGVNVVPAYTGIAERYHQLPGEGETITNVSLGTLDDASAAANPSDPCSFYASAYGPTTEIIDGQRYLDWPSMPLIPTYTASSAGQLDPLGETCGDDPSLTEIGLDFSMMSPLPHDRQRPGAVGSGLTDLLGIAPGAQYRLVVPASAGGAITDVDAAFLAAGLQDPRPDVITASLGFGFDQYGFSARYLEDDPMTQAVIATIVHAYHIVVCVSGGDGLRSYTNAPVPPSGGSVATNVTPPGGTPTDINDVGFSAAPSSDVDSGAIAVGSTTLDDIFSAPPQDPRNAALVAQHAFPETRYNGFREFASAYGPRMNVSAPGDNVLSLSHVFGADAKTVQVNNEGGTSASAPEVAAVAAVVMQVARLAGNRSLDGNPLAVRSFLAQTGTPVPAVPQSDVDIQVGPQVNMGNAVATLLGGVGYDPAVSAPRVAVEQRQQASALGGTISTATDAGAIALSGRLLNAWITISPDWVGLPPHGVSYGLAAGGTTLATTAWARLQPSAILAAAGQPLVSDAPRTVQLAYNAYRDGELLASVPVTLTFGPSNGTAPFGLAPIVPAVSDGDTIPVSYDIRQIANPVNPTLVVSEPGRVDPVTGQFFRPAYSVPLTARSGVVQVPVSALQGAGIYGIGIQSGPGGPYNPNYSGFAFTRVGPARPAQPAPPTFSYQGSAPSHYIEVPDHGSFQINYDVRNVPGATGAAVEVSAAGPTNFNNYNPFNNPNGSERDANGSDFGSVGYVALPGTHGTATLNSAALGMYPTMTHVVRVLATRSGRVLGEASGVSAAMMDGIRPTDGGGLANGFAVNGQGTDGFLTSSQATASGQVLSSVETFDQSTNAITGTVVSSSADHVYATLMGGCPGLFHGDVGLYDDSTATSDTFNVLNPVASGRGTGTWTPPSSELDGVVCPAANQSSDDTAVLAGIGGPASTYRVFTSNIGQNTFGPDRSLAPALSGMGFPIAGGIAQNTTTGDAIVGVADLTSSGPDTLVSVHLSDGTLHKITGVTSGFVSGVAVDEATNVAVNGSLNQELGVYDLTHGTALHVTPGGGPYEHPAVDSARGRIVVEEIAGPDFYGQTSNNNALSSVVTLDEQGNLLQRAERFNFFNIYLLDMGAYLQLNPSTDTGYVLGPGGTQLDPFGY